MSTLGLIHSFLNLVAPAVTLFSLFFFMLPFQIFNFFISLLGSLCAEDVTDKVVLITGASSGIGESLAYEYAKRGACLVLAARRESSLREVAENARDLGSPDVIIVRADVAKVADCRRVIDQTMNHFGRLDHLVNNAGITSVAKLEEVNDVTDFRQIMDVNFWGFVYMTKFAAPYLRNSCGRIVVLSSASSWMPMPKMSVYNASKAAISQFFETLRVEFGSDIGITLVTPGYVESEYSRGKLVNNSGKLEVDPETMNVEVNLLIPVLKAEKCAKAIVQGAVRGERYVTEPAWVKMTYLWKVFFPEVVEWAFRLTNSSMGYNGEKLMDYTGAKNVLYPETMHLIDNKRAD